MIDGVLNTEGISVLERLAQFAGARHRLIANNIANFDTPGYRPQDVSVDGFREQLAEAVDKQRAGTGRGGPLSPADSAEVEFHAAGLELHPRPAGDNILFHDGNDRDLDRTMQDLVENFLTYRVANELLRSRFEAINIAIRERL